MTIQHFGLTAEQKLRRREAIGGSTSNVIMSGVPERVLGLYEEYVGLREPEDLSHVLPVQIGTWTGPFNVHWYTLMTGNPVTEIETEYQSADHKFMRCTLDGYVEAEGAIFEAKHVNQFSKIEDVVQRYMPQLHHNMHVRGVSRAVLSVIMGTLKYEHFVVEADPFYTATLIEAEAKFWDCVQTLTPPGDMPAAISPALPTQFRTVDMTGKNEWAACAADWTLHKAHAKTFKTAEESLKGLVEFDVSEAFGHGVKISRSKNGALTIREMKP